MRLSGWRTAGAAWPEGAHVFTRDNVVAGVEQGLARMKTDYLDIVQFHASPSRQTLAEHGALDALLDLREAGNVRFCRYVRHIASPDRPYRNRCFRCLSDPVLGRQASSPLPLRRVQESSFAAPPQRVRQPRGNGLGCNGERWRQAHLDDLLDGMTPVEFILRFTFTNPDLDTTIVGTISPAHLQSNLDILRKGPLPPDLYEKAKQRFAAAGSAPQPG
jgi:aryl-alcohol dehydrogenase-like predicted oxidoreductase